MRYEVFVRKIVAVNNSKPGNREDGFQIVSERNGRTKVLDEYPSKDLGTKMYQTWKHELRENAKTNGTILKLKRVQKFSSNGTTWDREIHSTMKQTSISPYSKPYISNLRRMRKKH